ncbi:helix-turn-helix transcriptional regulator [Aerococcaceae bacterium 50-4]
MRGDKGDTRTNGKCKLDRERARKEACEMSAALLIKLREQKSLSQNELGRLTGRKQSYISRIESKNHNISLVSLVEIVESTGSELSVDVEF